MAETQEQHEAHKGLKKGLYLIPTSFTAANVAMGFFAVLAALRGFQIVAVDPSPDRQRLFTDELGICCDGGKSPAACDVVGTQEVVCACTFVMIRTSSRFVATQPIRKPVIP